MISRASLSSIRDNPTGNRLLFFGVNILALVTFYILFVAPAQYLITEGAQGISDRRQTLARYAAIATHEKEIQDYARQVSDINGQGEMLDGDSDGVINANLQARLKEIAETSEVAVRSIQMLPDKPIEGVTLVGARIDVSGSYERIHDFARALENGPPLLLITAASLRGQAMIWGAQQAQQGDEIEAQFDIFGGAPKKGRGL